LFNTFTWATRSMRYVLVLCVAKKWLMFVEGATQTGPSQPRCHTHGPLTVAYMSSFNNAAATHPTGFLPSRNSTYGTV
jgi:hypothetical protein